MPIQQLQSQIRLPIIGKIRLGITKKSSKGNEYPENAPFFVLHDAPDVIKVYGEQPQELEVMFPSDDEEQVMSAYLRMYKGGRVDKDGKRMGGKIACYGNGPDSAGNPGVAHHVAARDPVSRIVPTRPCAGPGCPDWKSCKPSMRVCLMLPRVSKRGVFLIETTSMHTMGNFHNHFMYLKQFNAIAMTPFYLRKEKVSTSYYDQKKGKEVQGEQWVIKLYPDEDFADRFPDTAKELVAMSQHQLALPGTAAMIEAPMEDNYPATIDGQVSQALPAAEETVDISKAVANSDEVKELFASLAKCTGKAFTAKSRLVFVRKFEGSENLRDDVIARLQSLIQENTQQSSPPPAQNASPSAGGLI